MAFFLLRKEVRTIAEIDSLEIVISASMEKANQSIKEAVKGLELITKGLSIITKNSGFEEFAKEAKEFSSGMKEMSRQVTESIKPISEQARKMTKDLSQTLSEFQNKYGDLGKGFRFTGTDAAIQKQVEKYTNALENAKLKKHELELSGKTEGLGYEDAVKDVLKYANMIESLKSQLLSLSNTQSIQQMPEVRFYGFEEDAINKYTERLKEFDTRVQAAISGNGQMVPTSVFEDYLSQLRKEVPEAKELILSYEEELKRLNEINAASNFGKFDMSQWEEQLRGTIGITEGAAQKIKSFREQLTQLQVPPVNEENLIKLQNTLQKTKEKMVSLKTDMSNKLTMGKISDSLDDSGYRNLREQIALTGKTIDALQSRIQEVSERTRISSAEMAAAFESSLKNLQVPPIHEENIEKLEKSLEKAEIKLEELQTKLANGLTMGRITESIDDSGYRNLREQIALTETQIEGLRSRIQEVGNSSQYVGLLESSLNGLRAVARAPALAMEGIKFAISGISSKTIELASITMRTLGNVTLSTAKIITGSLLSGLKNTALKIGSLSKSIVGLGNSSKKMGVSFAGGFKNILKYTLGIRSLYTLMNKLRRAIVDGFKNLSLYSNEVNASLSMLKSSLNTFKNASAAALSPLLNAMAPALNTIIQTCTRATNAINQLLSALFGKGMWIRAKDQTLDFAAGVKKAGKAAKNGTRQFDELKLISTDSGSSDSGTNPADMFETVPIDDKFKDWADRLKEMWKNADFTDLGSSIGDWLKNTLDNIDWGGIKEKVAKLGASFATLLNGIFETEGLGYSIGNTLAQSINTGFEFLNEFVHNLHWNSLGQFIAESINGFTENLDWDLINDTFVTGAEGLGNALNSFTDYLNWDAISSTVSNFVNTYVDTIYAFVTTVDWKSFGENVGTAISNAWTGIDWSAAGALVGESFIAFFDFISSAIENVDWWAIGESVKDFLVGIDWNGVADSFFEAVGAAFGGFAAFLSGLLGEAIASLSDWWNTVAFDENGNFTIKGLLNGISESLKNIGAWVKEHIFQPFITGFKNAFGIHSPSTVMEEQGNFIIEGLLNGITSLVGKVTETWESMKTTAIEIWGTVSSNLSEKWETLKTDASTKFGEIKSNVSEAWENLKSDTSDKWNTIKSNLSELWGETKENASNTFGTIKDSITDSWNELKENTSRIWNGIKNAIKTPINVIIGFINGLVSGVVGGINAVINALNGLSFEIPEWLSNVPVASKFAGKTFGFNISPISVPPIPELATGAVFRGGNPFMAIVNDQPRGQTNIEAPLKVIRQALREEITSLIDNVQLTPTFKVGQFQPAPPPEFDFDARQRGAYQIAAEIQRENSRAYSDSDGYDNYSEEASLLMSQNQLLRRQNELLEQILRKPTMEISDVHKAIVRDSMERGGNIHGGNMGRLAVAQELYR